jgi:hypothetical protein
MQIFTQVVEARYNVIAKCGALLQRYFVEYASFPNHSTSKVIQMLKTFFKGPRSLKMLNKPQAAQA